jgi:Ca-activated chloride channel homolog
VLTAGGERRIRKSAFEEIFGSLAKAGPGYHAVRAAGEGVERFPRPAPTASVTTSAASTPPARSTTRWSAPPAPTSTSREEDLEVHETEHLTSCATMVAIDVSHSMVLYGEDRITPAKTVALALTELITGKYPKDHLGVILFGDRAESIALADIPYVDAGPFHTNTREALQLARGLLARKKHPNKQIFLITDGKPSAITEGDHVYKNPFGLDLKIVNRTLEEADLCRRQKGRDHHLHDRHRPPADRLRREADQGQPRPRLLRLALEPGRVHPRRLHQEPTAAGALSHPGRGVMGSAAPTHATPGREARWHASSSEF